MSDNIFDYWPMSQFEPRESQKTVLNWMAELPADIKYVLCEVPVGGGKSPIGLNYSGWIAKSLGNSFVLTPQKILQKQYEESFEAKLLASVYGKGNYTCKSKNTNCDIGSDMKPKCESCPAREAFQRGIQSPNMVLNYHLALLYYYIGQDVIKPRKVMVLDECHTLENHLTEFNAVTISDQKCKKLGIQLKQQPSITQTMGWLRDNYIPKVRSKVSELADQFAMINDQLLFDSKKLSKADQGVLKEFKEYSDHLRRLDDLQYMTNQEISDRYVLINEQKFFKFKELYGKNVFNSVVKPMADKFLFMSSTILNKDAYCRDLGIDPSEAAFISLDSEFELENRPIIYSPVMKMSYGWNKPDKTNERTEMLNKIVEICDMHSDESGIIHTASFQIAGWLLAELQGLIPHRIMHHNPESGFTRDEVIKEFTDNEDGEPLLLISPSITEGLDLKDDKGRFAIISKVPYPYLGDAWIKKRMELSKEWYNRQAMISIIQGGGRIVRSGEDWGYTYILDASFTYLKHTMKKHLPDWWVDSIANM